jgi:penicillin-binding protein 1A
MLTRWWHYLLATAAGLTLIMIAIVALSAALIYPSLPSLDALTDYRPKVPLRIYTEDGLLIGEFGEERRAVVKLKDTPLILREAILAAEDERFYQHGGIDTMGVIRAALANIMSGGAKEGASTITMQVARNFFLTSEKTFRRKINEALLAIKIEHALTKDEIFELYINHIYLGQRAYGFAAAAQIYFGKSLAKLNTAEAAMLAGLPKAPSAYNPVVNPRRAKGRQLYVLGRMRALGYIDDKQYAAAKTTRLPVRYSPQSFDVPAEYVAEMVRQYMYQRYGDQIYVSGMKVFTTLHAAEQKAAYDAVRQGVVEFDRRHGYAGPEEQVALPKGEDAAERAIEEALLEKDDVAGLSPAIVLSVDSKHIAARLRSGEDIELDSHEVNFARRFIGARAPARKRLKRGSVIRVLQAADGRWQLTYIPQVEAAFVAISPRDGAIRALVGGTDFAKSQFNHVVQAWRQPGSSFKPFIYSAALERGLTPATVMDDAPITLDPFETGGVLWEPKNYEGTTEGPMTLRNALAKSKNLVSIRVLQAVGVDYAHEYVGRFGFDMSRVPPYLTMVLGAGEVTPLSLASAYAILANGGYRVKPYFITRITDKSGQVLETFKAAPPERVIDPRNAFIITSMLQDVVRRGTAAAAMQLGRSDLAGKTGTTNDHRDALFAGYDPSRVAVAWVGYDQPRPMGGSETGAVAALPIWMHYMAAALKDVPDQGYTMPPGIAVVDVDPQTGTPEDESAGGTPEFFYQEFAPTPPATAEPAFITESTPASPPPAGNQAMPATPPSATQTAPVAQSDRPASAPVIAPPH